MNSIIAHKLDGKLLSNDIQYYFTLLSNRFDYVNSRLSDLLERRYKMKFKPIYILQAEANKYFQKNNFIIVNKELAKLRKTTPNIIFTQDYEDLNIEFVLSPFINKLMKGLLKKQRNIFVISFTSFGLNFKDSRIINIGPDPKLVEYLDNKIEQINLFETLNLSRNNTTIHKNIEHVLKSNIKFPCFISPALTSGGHENKIVFNKKDLNIFYDNLREVNKKSDIFTAEYIENLEASPNITALINNKKEVKILLLTDQILRNIKHLGNIYPSKISNTVRQEILKSTKILGKYMAEKGYRGLFGCDFIVDKKDNCYIVDLNPRRQGSYLMTMLMMKKLDLLDLELKITLGESIPSFSYNEFQNDIVITHCKLKPHEDYKKITKEFLRGHETSPFENIGDKFIASFYPKGTIFNGNCYGYYINSGTSYKDVLSQTVDETEALLNKTTEEI